MRFEDFHCTFAGERVDARSVVARRPAALFADATQPAVALAAFFTSWFSPDASLVARTSGSTGEPKALEIPKEAMAASAAMTARVLGLEAGMRALLCMDLSYIGAKMMPVRSLLAHMELVAVKPSSHPFAGLASGVDFASMTPMQAARTLQEPEERRRFFQTGRILIGGGPVSRSLAEELRSHPGAVYATYGMTETVSHVALRRLSGDGAEEGFRALEGVKLSLSDEDALVIEAPGVTRGPVRTHDIARLAADGTFTILGRTDNVINSGGVKIVPEAVEATLGTIVEGEFLVTSVPDGLLGEKAVLLAAREQAPELLARAKALLAPYHAPKAVAAVGAIPVLPSGKPDRMRARRLAREIFCR